MLEGDRAAGTSRPASPSAASATSRPTARPSSGAWIYAGVFKGGKNLSKRRDNKTDPSRPRASTRASRGPGRATCTSSTTAPRATRTASRCPAGKNRLIWWDETKKKWAGVDTPDVPVPTDGPDTENGQRPFRMTARASAGCSPRRTSTPTREGRRKGLPRDSSRVLVDGPLPEFYEPVESPVANVLHPNVADEPRAQVPAREGASSRSARRRTSRTCSARRA